MSVLPVLLNSCVCKRAPRTVSSDNAWPMGAHACARERRPARTPPLTHTTHTHTRRAGTDISPSKPTSRSRDQCSSASSSSPALVSTHSPLPPFLVKSVAAVNSCSSPASLPASSACMRFTAEIMPQLPIGAVVGCSRVSLPAKQHTHKPHTARARAHEHTHTHTHTHRRPTPGTKS